MYLDEQGFFGSASGSFNSTNTALTYGTDFCLDLRHPEPDGSSRSGLLVRINDLWPRPSVRQGGYLSPFVGTGFGSIKVVYTGGYTLDSLPGAFRAAANFLVARMDYLMPQGIEVGSEGYEERSLGFVVQNRGYLLSLVKPMVHQYRNWAW